MELQYDENLLENKFYQHLQRQYVNVLETAPLEKWIVCVPRTGTFTDESLLNDEFIMAHILIHDDELPESHFRNFNGKPIKMCNKSLLFEVQGVNVEIAILFEEIFYTKTLQKLRIWCIETSLSEKFIDYNNNNNVGLHADSGRGAYGIFQNLEEALQFCFTEIRTKTNLQKIEAAVKNFIKNNGNFVNEDLYRVKNKTQLLYDHCLDIVLMNRRLSEKFREDVIFARKLKVAIEYYIMNVNELYKHLFNGISICCEDECEQFNKALKSLSDLSLSEFDIDPKFSKMIPEMKAELVKIDKYEVAAEKLNCLKRAFDLVSEKYVSSESNQHSLIVTIDELLPIFIFVIIKSDLSHWIPTIHFVKLFSLNCQTQPNQYFGAETFLITTLEATIMYILDFRSSIGSRLSFPTAENQELATFEDKENYLNYLFHQIQTNDEEKLIELLDLQHVATTGSWSRDLCHPLCDCNECVFKISQSRANVNSKNALGLTAMHVAGISGYPKMVTLLLGYGAKVNVRDRKNYTPLHYAAQQGHQNTLLLLLHAKANINAKTADDRSTPLHMSCSMGHESCAKAILYFSDHMNINLDVNAVNTIGTPLHLAAKWGFKGERKFLYVKRLLGSTAGKKS
jgi:ankyrin repeat domain-containing protein 27